MSELPDNQERDHSSDTISSFQIPPQFQQVEFSAKDEQLYIEDVQGTTELWLIKTPHNFDAKDFSSKKVSLSGRQFFNENEDANVSYELLASQNSLADKGLPHVFLPSRHKTSLQPAPSFKGQLSLIERLGVPSALFPPSPPQRSNELPPGLKQRFHPFGWEEPQKQQHEPGKLADHKVKSKKKKSRKNRKSEEYTAAVDNVEKVTMVARRGDTDGDERLHGAGDEEDSGVTTKERRKSKKRKLQSDIQNEDAANLHQDISEEKTLVKKKKKKHKK